MFEETYLVGSRGTSTDVAIGRSMTKAILNELQSAGTRCTFVGSGLAGGAPGSVQAIMDSAPGQVLVVSDGEKHKDLSSYRQIVEHLLELGLTRSDSIAYVGGGTLGDLVSFAASTYKRGIRVFAIPTTLLAMIDSSIGGKNGLDLAGVKNVIGTVFQPSKVLIDLDFLNTGSPDLKWGLAEAIKCGVALNRGIFDILAAQRSWETLRSGDAMEVVVARCVDTKLRIVKSDPFELSGRRSLLNFGHTIGHAIESAYRYSVPHGRAILTGMILELNVIRNLGKMKTDISDTILGLARKYGLELLDLTPAVLDDMERAIRADKKRNGNKLVVQGIYGIGHSRNLAVDLDDYITALREELS